jgi:hypothetical protein
MTDPSCNLGKRETSSHEDRGIKRVGTPIPQLPGGASPCMTEHGKSEIAHTRVGAHFTAECSAPTPADSGAVDQDSTRVIASSRNFREGATSAHGNRDAGGCVISIAELPTVSKPCNSPIKNTYVRHHQFYDRIDNSAHARYNREWSQAGLYQRTPTEGGGVLQNGTNMDAVDRCCDFREVEVARHSHGGINNAVPSISKLSLQPTPCVT